MTVIKKIFLYMLLFTLGNCGYEPLYSKKNSFNEEIQSFQLEGNKNINRKIISSLNLKNKDKATGYRLIINSAKTLESVSRNTAGNTSVYKTGITVKISLMNGDKVFRKKTFNKNFTYNNIENKFNLSQYQSDIEKNLINKIIEEIFVFFTIYK